MSNLEWLFPDEPVSDDVIQEVEQTIGVKFPQDYVECVKINNGASVKPYCFDVEGIERVFGALHSYDKNSGDYILKDYINYSPTIPKYVVPFGLDPAGNLICFDYKDNEESPIIVFWEHEAAWLKEELMKEEGITENQAEERARENVFYVADTFTDFLNKLHD